MTQAISICPSCGKRGLVLRRASATVSREDGTVGKLPRLPHHYCPHCGECVYDRDTVRKATSRFRLKTA